MKRQREEEKNGEDKEEWEDWKEKTDEDLNFKITCSEGKCLNKNIEFNSIYKYESHYMNNHVLSCCECNKRFPSERILQVHINEHHDPIIQVKQERGDKIFACFVENCDKVCSNRHKRMLHLIDKHNFPRSYQFSIVDSGIKNGQKSLLKRF